MVMVTSKVTDHLRKKQWDITDHLSTQQWDVTDHLRTTQMVVVVTTWDVTDHMCTKQNGDSGNLGCNRPRVYEIKGW